MHLTMQQIATATGGELVGDGSIGAEGASIDSRAVEPGQLFVAVVAERDGHTYVDAALDAGAAGALVDRAVGRTPAVVVADTLRALQDLGAWAAPRIGVARIGITGSVGKTSTKDLLIAACGGHWRTHGSAGSFNNELGLPLTILAAPDDTQVLVVEMGARGAGHIAELCRIARPTVGVVTAVGAAHTELFGTIADVAVAKGELVEALPASGTAVLNMDDPLVAAMSDRTAARVLGYGRQTGDIRAENVEIGPDLLASFDLATPWGAAPVILGVAGEHMVANALAAAAAALAVETPLAAVAEGLGAGRLSRWRMEVGETPTGATVINDAYNANPMSMAAAFAALADVAATRRVAVLGVMAELGAEHDAAHTDVGAAAAAAGFHVISVGVPQYGGTLVDDADEAILALADLGPLGAGDAVLVKGSRVAGLERVADALGVL